MVKYIENPALFSGKKIGREAKIQKICQKNSKAQSYSLLCKPRKLGKKFGSEISEGNPKIPVLGRKSHVARDKKKQL